ncbi:uncharacterized protein A4U43_C05F14040 [Asparagus officinalis]|uniref:Uncharacterized protein n=1 Tax=Asparagus officinalis TaxID=4686 RepID=A0A5P1EWW8_ASPOF|nr:uncharacterized protein A4U43_C05F14040 [Asparagus officinalis]
MPTPPPAATISESLPVGPTTGVAASTVTTPMMLPATHEVERGEAGVVHSVIESSSGTGKSRVLSFPFIFLTYHFWIFIVLRFLFLGSSSHLRAHVEALLSDDDPDKLLLCLEVSNFLNFVESLIASFWRRGSLSAIFGRSLSVK